jgi:hypothetical protein
MMESESPARQSVGLDIMIGGASFRRSEGPGTLTIRGGVQTKDQDDCNRSVAKGEIES